MLRRVVSGAVGDTRQTRDGRDVHDAARSLDQHHFPECLRDQEWCGQVDVDHTAEFFRGRVFGRADQADAGIVYDDVDLAPSGENGIREILDAAIVGNVADELEHVAPQLAQARYGFGLRL